MKIMIIRRKSRKKKSENKMQFPRGGVPWPPASNHTRGEVFRPPSQIENNPYCVVRTRDLDGLSGTRCALTIAARSSRNCILQ